MKDDALPFVMEAAIEAPSLIAREALSVCRIHRRLPACHFTFSMFLSARPNRKMKIPDRSFCTPLAMATPRGT